MNKLVPEGQERGVRVELCMLVCFQNARYRGMVVFGFTSEAIDFPTGYWYTFCTKYERVFSYSGELPYP